MNHSAAGQRYILSDALWPAGQATITYSFNDLILHADGERENSLGRSLSPDLRDIVREAMDAWESVCGVEFVEVADSTRANVRIGWQPYSAADPIYVSDGPGSTLGITWTWFSGNGISRQSVVFDPADSFTSTGFYDTALHELGHVLGIDHSDVRGAVLAGLPTTPYSDQPGRDHLTDDDIAAAQRLWGAPGGTRPPSEPDDGGRTLQGGSGNDTIRGEAGDDTIRGEAGDDRLLGGPGNDSILGGPGNDWLWGQEGNDHLGGDAGRDILYGMSGNDQLFGGYGGDVILGGSGDDDIIADDGAHDDGAGVAARGDGDDNVWGESGNDTIWGEGGNDFLAGGIGNDQLYGEGGRDYLAGESGHDHLVGGPGYDVLAGGSGNDRLIGGAEGDTFFGQGGADHFEYNGGTAWLMDLGPDEGDTVVFGNGASVIGLIQVGWHARLDMSDGGTIYAAWTNVEELDFI